MGDAQKHDAFNNNNNNNNNNNVLQIDRQIDSLLITDLQLKVELYDYLQKIEY